MGWLINRYNKKTSKQLGWTPEWFGARDFDGELEEKVKYFQKSHDLEEDGKVGINTYRRILLFIEAPVEEPNQNKVLINGVNASIGWDKVKIDLLPTKCYRKSRKLRKPTMIVTHWDVCSSASSCKRVLEKRGISTHFVIDNDGTIVQLVDTNNIAWHAKGANNNSIGIDISSAYYLKYQDKYEAAGLGKRPVLTDSVVHGHKLKPHMGYYKAQLQAYEVLVDFLTSYYDIPLAYPMNEDQSLRTGVCPDAVRGNFKGVLNHYNLTRNKIDTAGLKLDEIINSIKRKRE